jgi:uncharacterized membrane protein HdeD (DUF308 family)
MYYYVYAFLACIVVGIHIFSMKMMSLKKQWFYPLLALVLVTLIISRFLIYEALTKADNPTLVHLILNMSIFVTFFATSYFLPLQSFDHKLFLLGLFLVVVGVGCIRFSYIIKKNKS